MARRPTIASRLFLLVFGFSVAWSALTTTVQLFMEYRNTRGEVDANLTDLFQATRSGLENALWSFDTDLVKSDLQAARAVGFLSGARVRDESGAVIDAWGSSPVDEPGGFREVSNVPALAAPLYHRYPLLYSVGGGSVKVVGTLVLVTDLRLLADRLADRARLIGSNYLATTLGLMVILLVGLRRQVSAPLAKVSQAISGYRFDQAALRDPVLEPGQPDELAVLWQSFEALTAHLKESYLQQRAMSAILEEAAVMALVCDADGLVLSSNAQARVRLAGSHPGGYLENLSYGEESGPLFPELASLLAGGKPWRGELTPTNDRGQSFWLAAALVPLQVPGEPRARWGVMIEDVSARRLTEQYRLERDLAREATRARSLFLANVSHEIRTPMNAVVGLTALIQEEEVSPRAREYLQDLERSGSVLLRVINDILDFSKLEEGKLELETTDFRLAPLLEGVAAMARFQAEQKGIAFSLAVAADVPEAFRGDPLRLQQVLLNLTSNAVKFTDRGWVTVAVSAGTTPRSPGQVVLRFEVRDTGVGIAPADQERLFQSFAQLDASNTRRYGGTGLGLAICRQLVHLMKGQLGVESLLGTGSLFWFEVTLGEGASPDADLPSEWHLEGLRVLLAEDNRVNQLVARELLHRVGVHAEIVSDGHKAVERAVSERFDLVLMDLQMPGMDGLEAVRLIRKTRNAATLPILAMTAHTFDQERRTCLEAGMQDLVPKPVDARTLYRLLSFWRPAATTHEPAVPRAPEGSA